MYIRGVKLKARGPISALHIILCGPREHMIVLQKKKKIPMLHYIIHYESAYQYHKFLFLFAVLFIRRNWLWCAYAMVFPLMMTAWTAQRNKALSSSARAPQTEKHDILHSFNELKKSMEAFRHDFLLLFLRSYFNDKCPERIIACKSASNARAQTSPLAGGFPFIHSHRKQTRSPSVRHYMCALKNDLLSWI